MAKKSVRPETYRAEMDFDGRKLVLLYTNGKRSVLISDGFDTRYAMLNSHINALVAKLETQLVKV